MVVDLASAHGCRLALADMYKMPYSCCLMTTKSNDDANECSEGILALEIRSPLNSDPPVRVTILIALRIVTRRAFAGSSQLSEEWGHYLVKVTISGGH